MKGMEIKPCLCPNCGYMMDTARELVDANSFKGSTETHQPTPGDITICLKCQTVNVFKEDHTVEILPQEDWEKLSEGYRNQIQEFQRLLKLSLEGKSVGGGAFPQTKQ